MKTQQEKEDELHEKLKPLLGEIKNALPEKGKGVEISFTHDDGSVTTLKLCTCYINGQWVLHKCPCP